MNIGGFTSTEQANAIASILEHISKSDAYGENEQSTAFEFCVETEKQQYP